MNKEQDISTPFIFVPLYPYEELSCMILTSQPSCKVGRTSIIKIWKFMIVLSGIL